VVGERGALDIPEGLLDARKSGSPLLANELDDVAACLVVEGLENFILVHGSILLDPVGPLFGCGFVPVHHGNHLRLFEIKLLAKI